jgi:hypothetical protein
VDISSSKENVTYDTDEEFEMVEGAEISDNKAVHPSSSQAETLAVPLTFPPTVPTATQTVPPYKYVLKDCANCLSHE